MDRSTQAMVLKQYNAPLVLEEIAIPKLKDGELLIKIDAAGVCGSDVHAWKGEDPRVRPAIILGHEGVGTIVGAKRQWRAVTGENLAVGDRVLWNRGISCGRCYHCVVMRQPALCPNRVVYGLTMQRDEAPYLNGCYAGHIVLREGTDLFKVPGHVDPAVLVAASCSGATTAHGFDLLRPENGDFVLIQGSGPLAMFSVALARAAGAREIVVIGTSRERLEACKIMGATVVMSILDSSSKDRYDAVQEMTRGIGVDFAVEAVGRPEALREVLGCVKTGGSLLSMGFGQPLGTIEFDGFHDLVRKNLRIQGAWVSDTRHTFQALNLILGNVGLFQNMITHRFALSEADEALKIMASEKAVKAVLIP